AIVERSKDLAIHRAIAAGGETALMREDLLAALAKEYVENELFPPTDNTEDWLKLTDFDPENVVRLGPVKPRKAGGGAAV
ncbi:MAG TPA: peptidase, partial [Verrucomicrobiota bacterium]|nr:peptidase [Verrucomicrobiota bacterium]